MKSLSKICESSLKSVADDLALEPKEVIHQLEGLSFFSPKLEENYNRILETFLLDENEERLLSLLAINSALGGGLLLGFSKFEELVRHFVLRAQEVQRLKLGVVGRWVREDLVLCDPIYSYLVGEEFGYLDSLNFLKRRSCQALDLPKGIRFRAFKERVQKSDPCFVQTHDPELILSSLDDFTWFECSKTEEQDPSLGDLKILTNVRFFSVHPHFVEARPRIIDLWLIPNLRLEIGSTIEGGGLYEDRELIERGSKSLWEMEASRRGLSLTTNKLDSIFPIGLTQIRQAFQDCGSLAGSTTAIEDRLTQICRSQNTRVLEKFCRRIETQYRWEDLVLPSRCLFQLKEAERFILTRSRRNRFSSRHTRGQGVSLVLEGPSGTGKTMAAEVLAESLGLNLYQVQLSQVTSKYVGETEKNLSQIFEAARLSSGILFFDEGEALFSKRASVESSQDKYSNLEVNHLLQELEAFEGIVIISTNFGDSIDSAFLRRIDFEIRFPRPNLKARRQIWDLHFRKDAEVDESVSLDFLAELPLTGGLIKNVVAQAYSIALWEGRKLSMKDIMHAMRREFQKQRMPIQREQFGDVYWRWVSPDWETTNAESQLRKLRS